MNTELNKEKILKMVEDKEITADQGMQMIKALRESFTSSKKDLYSMVTFELVDAASYVLKLDASKISVDAEFKELGFDSISLANFNNYIIDNFGFDIDPYMYFECSNMKLFALSLIEKYRDELQKYFDLSDDEIEEAIQKEEAEKTNEAEMAGEAEKSAAKCEIHYDKSPIWMLDIQKEFPKDRMLNFWNDIQKEDHSEIQLSNISLEQLKAFKNNGLKYMHLLIDSYLNCKVEVIIAGEGKPILYINPVGMTAPTCIFQMEELSKHYQFILINAPGCGLSELVDSVSFSGIFKLYIDVLNTLDITEPVHVIGISWGGLLAQGIAMEFPEKLTSMTLVGTTSIQKGEEKPENKNQRMVIRDFENIGKEEYYKYVQLGGGISKDTFRIYNDHYVNEDVERYDSIDYLSKINTPTLIIAGEKDIVIDNSESKYLNQHIKSSKYYEIAGAGHCPFLTHHEEFNKVVKEFIDQF